MVGRQHSLSCISLRGFSRLDLQLLRFQSRAHHRCGGKRLVRNFPSPGRRRCVSGCANLHHLDVWAHGLRLHAISRIFQPAFSWLYAGRKKGWQAPYAANMAAYSGRAVYGFKAGCQNSARCFYAAIHTGKICRCAVFAHAVCFAAAGL